MKKSTIFILISSTLLIIPILAYMIKFWKLNISDDTQIWGSFGDYLNGTFMPIIALLGVLVTYYLGIISDKRNASNIKIEQLKHRPILHIGYFDAENYLEIFLENKGNGPLIIKDYKIINELDNSEETRIFDCLPKLLNDDYSNYTGNIKNIVMKADEKFQLFLYTGDINSETFLDNREKVRKSISKFRIYAKYQDVYENLMPTAERSLIWFGRQK